MQLSSLLSAAVTDDGGVGVQKTEQLIVKQNEMTKVFGEDLKS